MIISEKNQIFTLNLFVLRINFKFHKVACITLIGSLLLVLISTTYRCTYIMLTLMLRLKMLLFYIKSMMHCNTGLGSILW